MESHPDRAPAGTWLALDPRSGEAVLCARLGPDEVARYEDVVGAVEAFVARLGELRDGLPGADLGPPPETPRPMRDDPLWLHSQFLRG